MPVLVGTDPLAGEEFPTDALTQAWLGDSGIVLGDVDEFGCRWNFNPTNAWGPKPAPREQSGDRTYGDGQWDATRYYGPRVMPIPGTCRAPDHAALHAAEQRLRDAITVEPFGLRIVEPGFDGYAMVRQQGPVEWTEVGRQPPIATFLVTLFAPDPLIYSMRERSFTMEFPTITGGLVWPTTWPAVWDTDVVGGNAVLDNPGSEPVGLHLRVDGPAETVVLTFAENGQQLHLANPDGPLLAAEQWMGVDTTTRQVLLNGDAGRRSWAYGDWLRLPPNLTTTLVIAGTGVTTDSRVSGTYRAARR